jgi:hypothetical protein
MTTHRFFSDLNPKKSHLALGTLLAFAVIMQSVFSCTPKLNQQIVNLTPNPNAQEKQLTQGLQSYFLNHRQAFSSDDAWLAFDSRTDDPKMGANDLIGMVNLQSGEIKELYRVPGQQAYGPGSGAVSFSPTRKEVAFIRGLLSSSPEQPYHFTRRSAIGLNLENPDAPIVTNLDARDVTRPFTPGALRGGSHAYSYTADGEWLSFTYNDEILEQTAKVNPAVKDLRTVAFMMRDMEVDVEIELEGQEFSGTNFSLIVAEVIPFPKPGSDEILKASEEAWVGTDGYIQADGEKVFRAMAYSGTVVNLQGGELTEVFVTDIPRNWEKSLEETDLTGSENLMPQPPRAFTQRRVTYTADRKFPGVQGPRHWLKTSQSGDRIFFYAKSDDGIVQLFSVSPEGGELVQITHNDFSPDTAFSLSPDDQWIAFGYQSQVYLTAVATGKSVPVGPAPKAYHSELGNFNWSYSGHTLAYNRKVKGEGTSSFQIFTINPFNQ